MPHDARPKFLNLFAIRLPVGGVASFLHRITGALLFLSLPFGVYLFECSLRSATGFDWVVATLRSWPLRVLTLLLAWVVAHHLLAGIRFLLLDLEWGIDKARARRSAWLVLAAAPLLALLVVWRLW